MSKHFLCFFVLCLLGSCANNQNSQNDQQGKDNRQLVAMVLVDNQYGFINTNGEFIIKPQYPLARTFSDGVACVNIGGQRNNGLVQGVLGGKYYFIDIHNKKQFDGFFSNSPMSFYNEVAIVEENDNSKTLLNKEGKKIATGFSVLGDCQDNLLPAVIEKNEKLGFINTKGAWAIELPYKYFVTSFSEQLSSFTDTDTKLSGYFNTKGEIAIPATYQFAGNFSEGFAKVKKKLTYSYINREGKQVIADEFENAGDFKNGLCAVQKGGQWGFLDKSGKLVIEYKNFMGVREYSDGRIAFKSKNGKVGYLDGKGNIVIKPQFDNGLNFKNGYAIIESNGKIGFIDTTGKIIIEPKYTRAGNFVDPNESNKIMKVN